MAKTLSSVAVEVLTRLGDTAEDVWTEAEIQRYLKEGYDRLAYLTKYFWGFQFINDVAGQATHTLDSQIYEVERATWDGEKLKAMSAQELLELDPQYRTVQGRVEAYTIEQDGLRVFRKYKAPSDTVTGESDQWGIPKTEVGTESDQWGIPRTIDNTLFTEEDQWGIPRTGILGTTDELNTKIEFSRRGSALNQDDSEFEFQDFQVKYVRHYAMSKALHRESPGQDQELAAHYMARFEDGVKRTVKRKRRFQSRPARQFGGVTRRSRGGPTLAWGPEFPVRDS